MFPSHEPYQSWLRSATTVVLEPVWRDDSKCRACFVFQIGVVSPASVADNVNGCLKENLANSAVEPLPFSIALLGLLLSQVDGVFSKVGYDPAADAQVTRRAPTVGDEVQGQATSGGGLPRIDLSTLLEKVNAILILWRWVKEQCCLLHLPGRGRG